MLADTVDVQPNLVGQLDLLEQGVQAFRGRGGAAGLRVGRGLAEGVDAEFQVMPRPACGT
jgi:hypothetical protein